MDDVRKLKEAAEALIGIVEGINGAMNHGTWRAEKSNLRMKDTDEWVRFYNATRALTPASDGRSEGLREAATDRVTDWLVPEMADEITRLRAENGVLRDDHGRLQTKACVAVDAARNAEAESTRLRAEVERLQEERDKEIRAAEIRGQAKAGAILATSGAEAKWVEDCENACPYCGGSGHKDDVTEASHD